MVQRIHLRLTLLIFILITFILTCPVFAEVKVFDKVTKWCASKDQSQSQAEKLAVLEAQQQAIEEAGVFISSLTVVKNYKLEKDEITKLASAILQTKTPDTPSLSLENNTYCVRVRTVIQVDTSTLNPQIEAFMKDKGARKKADEDAKTIRELREQMANLKSSDVKRLEEMNAQAIALEREREKQRLLREEQTLKARGELSRAEADRIAKEREMQERINQTLAQQEKAKRDEVAALAAEQDKIKRAQLENEQRWNDLTRKAKLAQDQWISIDDSLSLKQAMEEVKDLKKEIANIKNRLDFQYEENIKNLKAAYAQQRALSGAKLPPAPAPKDAFETTATYNARISIYEHQVQKAEMEKSEAVEMLKKEETLKLAEAKVAYLVQQLRVLEPFIKRLQELQARKFTLPEGGTMTVELGEPDADNSRFPLTLKNNGQSWSAWWDYTDRNSAKDFYRTRTHLKAEGLFQISEKGEVLHTKLTAARVTHLATKEAHEFNLEIPATFSEIDEFAKFMREGEMAKATREKAKIHTLKEIGKHGRFIVYEGDIVLDTKTNLMWAAKDNGKNISWQEAKLYCEKYSAGGYADWRMPTAEELRTLYEHPSSSGIKNRHGYRVTKLIDISSCCPWTSTATYVKRYSSGYEHGFFGYVGWSQEMFGSSSGDRALPVRSAQ
ncbi:MAG: hypothetical protein STSR0003_24230 [Smithella sp.]|jgi:hypothetical protein